MASTAVLSTLHHVTERKLDKLAGIQRSFEAQKKSILDAAHKQEQPLEKLRVLLDSIGKHNIPSRRTGISIDNVKRSLSQAHHDPSVSPSLLNRWRETLEHDLDIQGLKYEYASLFGRLVTEWIKNPKDGSIEAKDPESSRRSSDGSDSTASFEQIGREEMHEQRKEWESYAFNELSIDQDTIWRYLQELFGSTSKAKKLQKAPLENLRDTMKKFDDMHPQRFDANVLRTCIKGVLKTDLFAGRKREALLDLQDRSTVLTEMADVLNMDLDSLDYWSWDPSPVPVEMRRQLNGKYRVFMDEELHQAILLHFIGAKWAAYMKSAFTSFFHSGAWKQNPFRSMDKRARQRRQYFLGTIEKLSRLRGSRSDETVRNARRTMYKEEFFMTQLPSTFHEGSRDYGDNDSTDEDQTKSPLAIKQSMLHLATTELLLNKRLYGQCTITQSDFKWFGPALSDDTINVVLKFFGVPSKWLRFFKKFLETPLVFTSDGPDAQPQVRKRGIPMSHALSDALGEAVLFVLDFAVNQKTGGANLYRFHDDLWFWGQESVCVKAWQAMKEFSDVMGLELNEKKTGTVQISENTNKSEAVPSVLPKGDVRWGFLQLDSTTGRWIIDTKQVDEHIVELQRQLAACRSVFAWVQAWNNYVSRFFVTNFGQPANCFGRDHVQMVIETFEHIQRMLFADKDGMNGSVTEYLKKMIFERFGISDMPDGFFYFPVELGGLELRNPFISLFAIRRNSFRSSMERIERAFEEEEEAYEKAKTRFENGDYIERPAGAWKPDNDEPFMSFEEYMRFSEETSLPLGRAYENLMDVPPEDQVETTREVGNALEALALGDLGKSGVNLNVHTAKPYWKWIFELYAGDVMERFSGLGMGERGLLPIGLVSMLRSEKVRWQG